MDADRLIAQVRFSYPGRWVALKHSDTGAVDPGDCCSAPSLELLAFHLVGTVEEGQVVLIVAPGGNPKQKSPHHLAVTP